MEKETPILYYWGPCPTCAKSVTFAQEHGIELDKRDVEQEQPYAELLALGGDANQIPYLYANDQLIQGVEAINSYLSEHYL
ncbi:MAG: glutaredoxin family protein [Coriobacteriales bacterium]|jgi:glutaredoxin